MPLHQETQAALFAFGLSRTQDVLEGNTFGSVSRQEPVAHAAALACSVESDAAACDDRIDGHHLHAVGDLDSLKQGGRDLHIRAKEHSPTFIVLWRVVAETHDQQVCLPT